MPHISHTKQYFSYEYPYHRCLRVCRDEPFQSPFHSDNTPLIAVDLVQLVAQSPPVYPVGCNPFGAELYHHYSEYISWDKLHTPGKKKLDIIIHLAGNTD